MKVIGTDPLLTRAYFAGLIDGEGYIGATRRAPTARNHLSAPKYSVRVSVAMTDREPVALLAAFCNASHRLTFRKRAKHYKPIYELDLENEFAVKLLRELMPYLVCKQRQAELALELAALRGESRRHRTKVVATRIWKSGRAAGSSYRQMGLSDEFIQRCEVIYQGLLRISPRSGNGRHFQCV